MGGWICRLDEEEGKVVTDNEIVQHKDDIDQQ